MSEQQPQTSGEDSARTPSRRDALKWFSAGGGAVAASSLLAACKGATSSKSGSGAGAYPKTPAWKFVFINHVTTNSFFVPTKYGLSDAAKLLGLPTPQWTGSETGDVPQMVSAFDTAISSGADGIAIALTDNQAFIAPTKQALAKGIPVIAYNATAPKNYALSYVGQDLYQAGVQMGQRIAQEVSSGKILVGISQPGGNNVQPRLDGLQAAVKSSGKPISIISINTGAAQGPELNAITAAYDGHRDAVGMYAVDAGTTEAIAQLITSRGLTGKIHAGGFDLLSGTVSGVHSGALDFTIDQSAYYQGFLPVLYLYLYRMTGTLVKPPETDTGLTFVTKDNIAPYLPTSRFEGTTGSIPSLSMPNSIPLPPPSTVQL